MTYTSLISVDQLLQLQRTQAAPLILDCSFELSNPAAGRQAHAQAHIPGARYVHLDEQLSGPKTGRNGRHPLPSRAAFEATMRQAGLNAGQQVVAYDNAGGMYAARLWWLLRWAGHAAVCVLDGGLQAWTAAGQPVTDQASGAAAAGDFALGEPLVQTVDFQAVKDNLASDRYLVLDARAPDRFRGENETMDPVGGHIPGARNRLFKDNLDAGGKFKPVQQLQQEFAALAQGRGADRIVCQCGSGVTACHNLLAMEWAGLVGARLYPGSWSEWCAQPGAPIATGAE